MFNFYKPKQKYLLIGIGGAGGNFIEYCRSLNLDDSVGLMTINNEKSEQSSIRKNLQQQHHLSRANEYLSTILANQLKTPKCIVVISGAGDFGCNIFPFFIENLSNLNRHIIRPILIAPFAFEASRLQNYETLFNKITAVETSYPSCVIPKVFSNAELLSRCPKQLSLTEFFSEVNSTIVSSIGFLESVD